MASITFLSGTTITSTWLNDVDAVVWDVFNGATTVAGATARLNSFIGDSGSGGTKGLVPAPAAGDAAAGKVLHADGSWSTIAGSGDVVGPASATANSLARFDGTTGKLLKDGAVIGVDVQAYDADIATTAASQVEMEAGTEAAVRSMSPLRVAQAISALGSGGIDYQTFSSSGTWTKPATGTRALIEIWGGGGSGSKGANNAPGGGGGGGGYSFSWFSLSSLGATETVTIGAGGAAQTTASTAGNVGGNTTFGAHLTAYGGGGGGYTAGGGGGGGGGSRFSAGATGAANVGGDGGGLGSASYYALGSGYSDPLQGDPFRGGSEGFTGAGGSSMFGGGGGGSGSNTDDSFEQGGCSVYGGGGGAGAKDLAGAHTRTGGNSVFGGGGGGAGAISVSGSSGGTSIFGGSGGAGAIDSNNATAGSAKGGGGGGSEIGDSGAGGDGYCQVTVF